MSNMKPAGYLNTMTGHILTPEEQPDAAEHTGIYEPLVRMSDVMGLVAENDALTRRCKNLREFIEEDLGDPKLQFDSDSIPETDAFTAELRARRAWMSSA